MVPLLTLEDVLSYHDASLAIAVASGGPRFSRAELRHHVRDLISQLLDAGVAPGDVVSVAMGNSVEFVIAFMAITQARAVAAPLNASYTQDEFKWYLEDASCKLLLLPPSGNKAAEAAAAHLRIPVAMLSLSLPPATQKPPGQTRSAPSTPSAAPGVKLRFHEGDAASVARGRAAAGSAVAAPAAAPAGAARTQPPRPDDVALLLHTSGTTNKPKAVPLTHANLVSSLANIIDTYALSPADTSYLVMPLFHVHGLMAGLLAPLAAAAGVVLPASGRFSAASFWPDCVEHRVTFYTAVPTIHQVLLARAPQDYPAAAPPPLRFIRSCSSSLAPATMAALEATFKAPVLEAYAMTEAAHQMTSNPLPARGARKPGSVGRAQGCVQVAVLSGSCQVLPAGSIGEVCIRGANVTPGYLHNPGANTEAFAGGWFHTGDQGSLDEEGYLTLTGRLKELINRGGEKISPLEVDAVLLAHPLVAEAASFGMPDDKYGEVVAAAVVLRPGGGAGEGGEEGAARSIREHCAAHLAAFKVPSRLFITPEIPKGSTGKVQRRLLAPAFCAPQPPAPQPPAPPPPSAAAAAPTVPTAATSASPSVNEPLDGYTLVAAALAKLGVRHMFGVVGIPVTQLASAAQAGGVRFIGHRNEQAAGYAAAAAGYLEGMPAALLTVSGPGAVHGVAGASHAQVNCWPLLMLAGSCETSEIGKGAFQEADQVALLRPHTKFAASAGEPAAIPGILAQAAAATVSGRPGAAYVDLPSDVLMARLLPGTPQHAAALRALAGVAPLRAARAAAARGAPPTRSADAGAVRAAATLLRGAARPLLVAGKGAAYSGAEAALLALAERARLPVLLTSMGRGLLPDAHPLLVSAARAGALAGADVAVVVGARLNWQLHFGESPRWAAGVKFVLADVEPSSRDAALAQVVLQGDATTVLQQLLDELEAGGVGSEQQAAARSQWVGRLQAQASLARAKLEARLSKDVRPLDFLCAMRVIRDALAQAAPSPTPVIVSEGANTMDMARLVLPAPGPRTRLDAGTWGTMGVGLGYAVAAAVVQPGRLVVAVEGDSAFGFSGMEVETIVRYNLPVVIIVFNNGGIYGGDRRQPATVQAASAGAAAAGFAADPRPTAFVAGARYDALMAAFGGDAYHVADAAQLAAGCASAFAAMRPALIDIVIDPQAGVESGNVHAFNAPPASAKL